jgi:hypothetical protein
MNFEEKTKNQGTSQPEASQEEKVNGDIAELVELDDVQLATVVGGGGGAWPWGGLGEWYHPLE